MGYVSLTSYKTGKPLFAGFYPSTIACLEDAIRKETDLSYIDLSHQDLSNGNFDNACMPFARMIGANLSGANLSEACLANGLFHHADLYNTCLCYSDLRACDFTDCNFGGTDITGADISFSFFSTLSCFDLDFFNAAHMQGCIFLNTESEACEMSFRPIVVKGLLSTPMIIFDKQIKIGKTIFSKDIFPSLMQILEDAPLAIATDPIPKS